MCSTNSYERIKVIVRIRPFTKKELEQRCYNVVNSIENQIILGNEANKSYTFTFDKVFDQESMTKDIYDSCISELIDFVIQGFNGTIFAYGQTGTGKTFTMEGNTCSGDDGIIPLSLKQIYSKIFAENNSTFLVKASYLEIYKECIKDLLVDSSNKEAKIEIKETKNTTTNILIKGLTAIVTKNFDEIYELMQRGNVNRSTGATNMNEHSSRSHAIFIVTIESSKTDEKGQKHLCVGQLNLVDLAGSERQTKTGATGDRLKESTKINLSLCTLGKVISAIAEGKSTHIPYRDSKLTRILQNSLGGNAKTIMIANIGPADYNFEETLNTLRYANRAKNICNTPIINEDPKDATLRKYQDEIERLKLLLQNKSVRDNPTSPSDESPEGPISPITNFEDLEHERLKILNDHNMIKEEKNRLLSQLEDRENMLHDEELAQAKLVQRIKEIESQLLNGNIDLLRTFQSEQERELIAKRKLIAEEKKREQDFLKQLEAAEENTLITQETLNGLQTELDNKSKKMKKLYHKLKQLNKEAKELNGTYNKEINLYNESIEKLIKEMKFNNLIIENFIPPQVKLKYLKFRTFNEVTGTWKFDCFPSSISPYCLSLPFASKTMTYDGNKQLNDWSNDATQKTNNPFNNLKHDPQSGLVRKPPSSFGYNVHPLALPYLFCQKDGIEHFPNNLSTDLKTLIMPFNSIPLPSAHFAMVKASQFQKPILKMINTKIKDWIKLENAKQAEPSDKNNLQQASLSSETPPYDIKDRKSKSSLHSKTDLPSVFKLPK